MPIAKLKERRQARALRARGLPYKRIAANIGVSVGSVYSWTRDIELSAEQRARNLRGPGGPHDPARIRRAAATWAARCRAARESSQADGRAATREGNPLHLAGCMLYWAEGAKGRNQIKFSNSDPRMVVLFRRFLTDALAIERDEIHLSINVYTGNGLSIRQIERFWLDLLDLPRSSVRKHTLNHLPTSSSGRAKNKLPYGVCSLRVNSTWMLQHIYGAIQEYAKFEEPTWLG
jgi:Putative ATPase subunit of terminase (gpP-like)